MKIVLVLNKLLIIHFSLITFYVVIFKKCHIHPNTSDRQKPYWSWVALWPCEQTSKEYQWLDHNCSRAL